jgi:4-alpha-glucanotransferase
LIEDEPLAEAERAAERTALVGALAGEGCLASSDTVDLSVASAIAGAHEFIAMTPADLMLIQAEDLACMRIGVNLPGTDTERPNWRLRLSVPVDTLLTRHEARAILDRVLARGRGTVRDP